MTPDPAGNPPTDEELATYFRQHRGTDPIGNPRRRYCIACSHLWPCPTSRLIAALRASRAEVERLRAGLDFYADPANWESTLVHESGPGEPNPGSSAWESGAAIDGGERARRALNTPVAPPTLT